MRTRGDAGALVVFPPETDPWLDLTVDRDVGGAHSGAFFVTLWRCSVGADPVELAQLAGPLCRKEAHAIARGVGALLGIDWGTVADQVNASEAGRAARAAMAHAGKPSRCPACRVAYENARLSGVFHPDSDIGPWDAAAPCCGHLHDQGDPCPFAIEAGGAAPVAAE